MEYIYGGRARLQGAASVEAPQSEVERPSEDRLLPELQLQQVTVSSAPSVTRRGQLAMLTLARLSQQDPGC